MRLWEDQNSKLTGDYFPRTFFKSVEFLLSLSPFTISHEPISCVENICLHVTANSRVLWTVFVHWTLACHFESLNTVSIKSSHEAFVSEVSSRLMFIFLKPYTAENYDSFSSKKIYAWQEFIRYHDLLNGFHDRHCIAQVNFFSSYVSNRWNLLNLVLIRKALCTLTTLNMVLLREWKSGCYSVCLLHFTALHHMLLHCLLQSVVRNQNWNCVRLRSSSE